MVLILHSCFLFGFVLWGGGGIVVDNGYVGFGFIVVYVLGLCIDYVVLSC